MEMARTVATLPEGSRITDYISLGVITKTFPVSKIHETLTLIGIDPASLMGMDPLCGRWSA